MSKYVLDITPDDLPPSADIDFTKSKESGEELTHFAYANPQKFNLLPEHLAFDLIDQCCLLISIAEITFVTSKCIFREK